MLFKILNILILFQVIFTEDCSVDNCDTCQTGSTTICETCNSGYYLSETQCLLCDSPCSECDTSATHCTKCVTDNYLLNNACSTDCEDGYWKNNTTPDNFLCSACTSSCSTCDTSETHCTACVAGYFLDTNTCTECESPCSECDTSATHCTKCVTDNYLLNNACSTDCEDGYWKNNTTPDNFLCSACTSSCSTCDTSETHCTACVAGYFLDTNTCTECESPCSECDTSATHCTKCVTDNYLLNNACSTDCEDGYWKNNTTPDNFLCSACTSSCSTCDTSETHCTACVAGYFLDTNTCTECESPCSECDTSATHCTKCVTDNYLLNNACSTDCEDGYWKNNTTPDNFLCSACTSSCSTCDTSETHCTACVAGYFLDTNTCTECESPCSECDTSATHCTKCVTDNYLLNNACSTDCEDGYWKNTTTPDNFLCSACTSSCSTCDTSETHCTACVAGYFLDTNTCTECESPCSECDTSATHCTKCVTDNYLLNNACSTDCEDGYWKNNTTPDNFLCSACTSSCSTCDTSETHCTACVAGYFLDTNTCTECESPCSECDTSATHCTKCVTDNYLLNNACSTDCEDGYWKNNTTPDNFLCSACTSSCSTCDTSETHCTKCVTDNYLLNNACSTDCEDGYWKNNTTPDNFLCSACTSSCSTCDTSETHCTACVAGYFLDTNTCTECESPCSECDTSATHCTKCVTDNYLLNNACSTDCEDGYWKNETTPDNFLCSACTYPCETCNTSEISCTKCDDGSPLFLNSTSQTCVESTSCQAAILSVNNSNNGKICAAACETNVFVNTSNICILVCDSTCKDCSAAEDPNSCTSCSSSKFFDPSTGQCYDYNYECSNVAIEINLNLVENPPYTSNYCVSKCPAGLQRQELNNTCLKCHSNCKECSTPESQYYCTECNTSDILHSYLTNNQCLPCTSTTIYNPETKNCDSSCKDYYFQASNNTCAKCTDNCIRCTNENEDSCLECNSSMILASGKCLSSSSINCETQYYLDGSCVDECPKQYYVSTNPNICQKCYSTCLTCSGKEENNCVTCQSWLLLNENKKTCIDSCPSQTYEENRTCLSCPIDNCDKCNSENCTLCLTGFYMNEQQCLATCPDKTYGDSTNNVCLNCLDNCATCINEYSCTSCIADYVLTESFTCMEVSKFIEQASTSTETTVNSVTGLSSSAKQIESLGNLDLTDSTISETVQATITSKIEKSMDFLDGYVDEESLGNSVTQGLVIGSLETITNIEAEIPVSRIQTTMDKVIDNVKPEAISEDNLLSLFKTSSNLLKKSSSTTTTTSKSEALTSVESSSESRQKQGQAVMNMIYRVANIGLKFLKFKNFRRMLQTEQQLFLQYEQFSMILQVSSPFSYEYTQALGPNSETQILDLYNATQQINHTDLANMTVTYNQNFFEDLYNRIPNISSLESNSILEKVTQFNYLRNQSNKYTAALDSEKIAFASVITFGFQYQDPQNTSNYNDIDMNTTSEAIKVVVPLNYKTSGGEDLKCMNYNEQSSSWTDDNIETTSITDSYVVCKTNSLNAITVVDDKSNDIPFKKNYGIYFVIFQILFCAAVLFSLSMFIKLDNNNKLYFSISPWFCLFTSQNTLHSIAKLLLFLTQISTIEMVIALLYKKNEDLSEGGSGNIVLTIFFALLAGYIMKYISGFNLSQIFKKSIFCISFIGFMSAIYIAFSVITCYSISNPNHDDAVNLGVKTTFLALLFDFIIFDFLIILGIKLAKLELNNLKIFSFGGYLTIQQSKEFSKVQCEKEKDQYSPVQNIGAAQDKDNVQLNQNSQENI